MVGHYPFQATELDYSGFPHVANYVNDSRSYTRIFKPGTRYDTLSKKFVIREETRVEDEEAQAGLVRLTQEQFLAALNNISPNLRMTMEVFGTLKMGGCQPWTSN